MKKTFTFFIVLFLCLGDSYLNAQNYWPSKISQELTEKMEQIADPDSMFRIVIVMNEQYDAKQQADIIPK